MNRKSKKIVCLLLCSALLTSGLTSCSGNNNSSESSPNVAANITYDGTGPIAEETVELSVLTTNGASRIIDYENMGWQQEILKRANVKLNMEMIDPGSYADVIKPRLAAAVDLPDIVSVGSNDQDMAYINSGIFQDLTDYYDQYGFNLKKRFEETPGLQAEITTPDGKIYYVPFILLTVDWCRSIMVNQPWLDELGMDSPKTTEELYDLLKAIKETDLNHNGENDEVPLFMRAGYTELLGTLWGLDLPFGYKLEEDGTVTCSYLQPEYRDFLTYVNKLYSEGLLYSEFSTADLDTQTALFSNNQIGVIEHFMSNCTGYSQTIDPNWQFNVDEPIMQPILPPTGPYGDAYYYGRDPLGTIFAISKDCKNPELAFCFMDFMYNEEIAELAWYGFEGTDYNLVDGKIQFTDVYLKNQDDYRGKMGYNFEGLPGIQIPGSYGATQCEQIMEANEVIREHAKNPIGFSYAMADELEIIQSYKTDLHTYFSEMFVAFITGTTPLNDTEWDNYIANAKALHAEDVTAVYQAMTERQSQ
ncbi:MAG: extracellular solute-binding protein [Candidatus Merdivicinus sp.]|jgi:putative aldouronate transport system substrate-binding protein